MSPRRREKWDDFVRQAQEACPSLSPKDLVNLGGVLANLELAESRYNLLERLRDLAPGDLDKLNMVLEEWTVESAKIVLDELQNRLMLLHELERKVKDPNADEVQELQPLFHAGLWIFGPEFETIHFTSNRGMTKVIRDLFGQKEIKGSRNRPDFVIRPDGTVGLYSLPTYDDEGAENGINKVVIVELKTAAVEIGEDEKNQCWKYVKELLSKGVISSSTKVDCFALGNKLDPADNGPRSENDGRVKIIPMHYDTVLARARSRLFNLQDKVRNAPFLDRKIVEKFLHPDSTTPEQGSLHF